MAKPLAVAALSFFVAAHAAAAPFDQAVQRLRNRRIDLSYDGRRNAFRIIIATIDPATGDCAGTWTELREPTVPPVAVIARSGMLVGSLELTGDPDAFGFRANVTVRDIATINAWVLRYEGAVIAPPDTAKTFAAGVERTYGRGEISDGSGLTTPGTGGIPGGSTAEATVFTGSPRPFSTKKRQ